MEESETMVKRKWQKYKIIYKTLHRKRTFEQHEAHNETGLNSSAPKKKQLLVY
jgi:hypothetical protein